MLVGLAAVAMVRNSIGKTRQVIEVTLHKVNLFGLINLFGCHIISFQTQALEQLDGFLLLHSGDSMLFTKFQVWLHIIT